MTEVEITTVTVKTVYFCAYCQELIQNCFCLAAEMARPVNTPAVQLGEDDIRVAADQLMRDINEQLNLQILSVIGGMPYATQDRSQAAASQTPWFIASQSCD